jgi:hypothetical protein
MSTTNKGWNGSTLKFNGSSGIAVAPLTDLHQPDDPADFDTTGSTDPGHTHGAGLHKNSFTASCLGSHVPPAGAIVNVQASIVGGAAPTTKSYGKAFISQISVSGRKDGRIESSLTVMPGTDDLTPITYANSIGDLGFNGSTFSFAGTPFTDIVSANYTASSTPIDSTGAEVATADTVYGPGLADETLTITTLGGPQGGGAKSIGATVMAWKDGGTFGTGSHCKLMSTHPGGSLDGQTTTEHTFKVCRDTATADN